MSGLDKVVEFVRSIVWESVPVPVQHKVKLAFLDALGAALSGTLADISHI